MKKLFAVVTAFLLVCGVAATAGAMAYTSELKANLTAYYLPYNSPEVFGKIGYAVDVNKAPADQDFNWMVEVWLDYEIEPFINGAPDIAWAYSGNYHNSWDLGVHPGDVFDGPIDYVYGFLTVASADMWDGFSYQVIPDFPLSDPATGDITFQYSGTDGIVAMFGMDDFMKNMENDRHRITSLVATAKLGVRLKATPVSEPATMLLLGIGLLAVVGLSRRAKLVRKA